MFKELQSYHFLMGKLGWNDSPGAPGSLPCLWQWPLLRWSPGLLPISFKLLSTFSHRGCACVSVYCDLPLMVLTNATSSLLVYLLHWSVWSPLHCFLWSFGFSQMRFSWVLKMNISTLIFSFWVSENFYFSLMQIYSDYLLSITKILKYFPTCFDVFPLLISPNFLKYLIILYLSIFSNIFQTFKDFSCFFFFGIFVSLCLNIFRFWAES